MSRFKPSSSERLDIPQSKLVPAADNTPDTFRSSIDDDDGDDGDDEDNWWDDEESSVVNIESPRAPSRITQWLATAADGAKLHSKTMQHHVRKPSKQRSVQKPTRDKSRQRQKKQNAAAGIKLITDFSQHDVPVPQRKPNMPRDVPSDRQAGCFVDLAALKSVDNQAQSTNVGFWRSIKGRLPNKNDQVAVEYDTKVDGSGNFATGDSGVAAPYLGRVDSPKGHGLSPEPISNTIDLSPGDRSLVIGISIPPTRLEHHVTSPLTASSDSATIIQSANTLSPHESPHDGVPQTPSIIITPSQDSSNWFFARGNDEISNRHPRATSSVYSHKTPSSRKDQKSSVAPSVSIIPGSNLRGVNKHSQKRQKSLHLSLNTVFSEDVEENRSPVLSSCTVFEEDISPAAAQKGRPNSLSGASTTIKHTSIVASPDQRQSNGWWSYILTPFLTRSSTVASPRSATQEPPALPSIAAAATKSLATNWDILNWEKTFSPVTPTTSTSIASDAWWDKRNTTTGSSKSHNRQDSVNTIEEESGTLPFMIEAGDLHAAPGQEKSGAVVRDDGRVNNNNLTADSVARSPHLQSPPEPSSGPPILVAVPPSTIVHNHFTQPGQSNLHLTISSRHPRPYDDSRSQTPARSDRDMSTTQEAPARAELQPPPYSPPRPNYPRFRAVLPPAHLNNLREPPSPGPLSPGLQEAMASRDGIALSDVPLTPAPRRPINLNSGYPGLPDRPVPLPVTAANIGEASKNARRVEAKRRRHEKEDFIAHKAGGLWRGRGCISGRGCYGRSGAEGRKKRRWYLGLISGFLAMIILIVALATTLHHNTPSVPVGQSQWLNLTGFPPIFTGVSTVASPENSVDNTGCVNPATLWSCNLPKELQQVANPGLSSQPNFTLQIQWDNSSSANATFGNFTGNSTLPTRTLSGNAVSAGYFVRSLVLKTRQALVFVSRPPPPSEADQFFLGNTTDGVVSSRKSGEPTPFYVSLLSSESSVQVGKRDTVAGGFPNITAEINALFPPEVNPDGTAAAANLIPFPVQQPLRLYDRGLDSEHYGFYTYFNRSIFLKSLDLEDSSNTSNAINQDNENGGALKSEAQWRCTWGDTRFLVQMWTRKGSSISLLNGTAPNTSTVIIPSTNQTANDFQQPGSFPYPITITTDRHGGSTSGKQLYCYGVNGGRIVTSNAVAVEERKSFGGVAINPGPGLFGNSTDPSLGGIDGGTGGCSCQWINWKLSG